MPKTVHPAASRWFWAFVFVSFSFPVMELGAQTPTPTPTPNLKVKVKVVEVTKSGTTLKVDPTSVKLKRREEIVVWVTDGQTMTIDFRKSGNPSPGSPFTELTCRGRFCAALAPPDALGIFNYKVTVDGVDLDPNVEVIP